MEQNTLRKQRELTDRLMAAASRPALGSDSG